MGKGKQRSAFDSVKGMVLVKMLHPIGYIKHGHENCLQYFTKDTAERLINKKHAVLYVEGSSPKKETLKKKTTENVGDK